MKESLGNFDINKKEIKVKSAKRKLLEANICKKNKELILKYVKYRVLADNLGLDRQYKYMIYLRVIAEYLGKPFDKATKKDIEKLLEKIYNKEAKWGEKKGRLSVWGKHDYARILKTFFKWLKGCENPKETSWIKPLKPEMERLRPDEILTWDDVVKLSRAAMNPRDQAFPQVLWETGARIEEILTLIIKDVEMVNNGDALRLHFRKSKTIVRSPIIVRSAPALLNWIEKHPLKNNKEAPLWVKVNKNDKPMDYQTARKILKDLKERSKLDKPVNPHNFRKSSASFYSHYLSPAELKSRFGWKQSSKMLDIYCFPDEEKVNGKILEIEGIKERKIEENKETKPKKCNWCEKVNPAGADFCILCKRPLNPEKNLLASQLVELMDEGLKEFAEMNPEVMNSFIKFMRRKIGEGINPG